jgi:hypothetical protein
MSQVALAKSARGPILVLSRELSIEGADDNAQVYFNFGFLIDYCV